MADQPSPATPAGVEGEEGAFEVEGVAMAVATLRVPEPQLGAATEECWVDEAQSSLGAIGVVLVLGGEEAAGAEEVRVFEAELDRVGAAAAREAGSRSQGPDVASHDADVDFVAAHPSRLDAGIVEVRLRAQISLGLLENPLVEGLTGLEQQLLLDDGRTSIDVKTVGEPKREYVLARFFEVEGRREQGARSCR